MLCPDVCAHACQGHSVHTPAAPGHGETHWATLWTTLQLHENTPPPHSPPNDSAENDPISHQTARFKDISFAVFRDTRVCSSFFVTFSWANFYATGLLVLQATHQLEHTQPEQLAITDNWEKYYPYLKKNAAYHVMNERPLDCMNIL